VSMDNEERFALAARITELERELERVRACNRQGDALVALLQSQLAARRTVSADAEKDAALTEADLSAVAIELWKCANDAGYDDFREQVRAILAAKEKKS
jgi:hypothetical protein